MTEAEIQNPDSTDKVQGDDWPVRVVDLIQKVADLARTKAIRPLSMIAKAVTYGIVGIVLLASLSVLFIVALVRLLTVYATGGHVWITYLGLGGIFTLLGMFIWTRRSAKR